MRHGCKTFAGEPDLAWLQLETEGRAAKPAEAKRGSDEAMRAVLAAVRAAGIPADAVRTIGYSVRAETEYNNGRSRVRPGRAPFRFDSRR
jgi:uncharacterized protein YggE